MLGLPTFWNTEVEAPLFQRNEGFLKKEDWEKIVPVVQKWGGLVNAKELPADFIWPESTTISEENQRIVLRDAERTFLGEEQRQRLQRVLTAFIHRYGDYAQGLSYVTSFLLLVFDEAATMSILVELNERYVPGYWKHEAIGFATDALVFGELLSQKHESIAAHLRQAFILPETYCQKWFVGLGVHVLPFELLFEFFEGFLGGGSRYLFQFGLSVVEHLCEEILCSRDSANLYALLRLDPKHPAITSQLLRSIVCRTPSFAPIVESVDLALLRHNTYETKLRPRIEAAQRSFEESKQRKDSEDDSDEEEEDEEGAECQMCQEMSPEFFCRNCKLLLCGACHEASKGTHSSSHHVEEDWEEASKLADLVDKVHISDD